MSSVEQTDHQKGENSPERNGIQGTDALDNPGDNKHDDVSGDQLNTGKGVFASVDGPEAIDEDKIQAAFVAITANQNFDFSLLNDLEHNRMAERITKEITTRLITEDPLRSMHISNLLDVNTLKRSLVLMNVNQDQAEKEIAILQKRQDEELRKLKDKLELEDLQQQAEKEAQKVIPPFSFEAKTAQPVTTQKAEAVKKQEIDQIASEEAEIQRLLDEQSAELTNPIEFEMRFERKVS
jgi:hypothetical protein